MHIAFYTPRASHLKPGVSGDRVLATSKRKPVVRTSEPSRVLVRNLESAEE